MLCRNQPRRCRHRVAQACLTSGSTPHALRARLAKCIALCSRLSRSVGRQKKADETESCEKSVCVVVCSDLHIVIPVRNRRNKRMAWFALVPCSVVRRIGSLWTLGGFNLPRVASELVVLQMHFHLANLVRIVSSTSWLGGCWRWQGGDSAIPWFWPGRRTRCCCLIASPAAQQQPQE